MFISIPGRFLNVEHVVMIEKKDEKTSQVFMTNQETPIVVELSAAEILGRINRAKGLFDD